jgi:D-alanyl-D-alanine carboxypeptidase
VLIALVARSPKFHSRGLPAEEQITTARDQAVLGRANRHRFPGYYQYFATPSFHYKGAEMHNHNTLLGQVKGVDGIKTGYTEASGYNLVSSVRRDEKHIVAVVLGGISNAARDARSPGACYRQFARLRMPSSAARATMGPNSSATAPIKIAPRMTANMRPRWLIPTCPRTRYGLQTCLNLGCETRPRHQLALKDIRSLRPDGSLIWVNT